MIAYKREQKLEISIIIRNEPYSRSISPTLPLLYVSNKTVRQINEIFENTKDLRYDISENKVRKLFGAEDETPSFYTDINNRINPTFHSKLRQIIDTKMGGKMPAEDLQRMLKSNGIKDEELKWSYFDELIGDKKIVTKA